MTEQKVTSIAERFIQFLETGEPPEGLFTGDVFCDFTMPQWRLQAQGLKDVVQLRLHGHPGPGKVPRWRAEPTPSGIVIELEERWRQAGKDAIVHDWYCRELFWAKLRGDAICELSVYCTGDWDEARVERHGREVKLIRP